MKLILIFDSLAFVRWWIDAYYNKHDNCRDHTGIMMILGRGAVISLYLEHTLNVNSLIEREIVGEHGSPNVVLWSNNLI